MHTYTSLWRCLTVDTEHSKNDCNKNKREYGTLVKEGNRDGEGWNYYTAVLDLGVSQTALLSILFFY